MRQLAIYALLFFASLSKLFGQQLPLYALYRDNWPLINPAGVSSQYILYEKSNTMGASYRKQWLGIDGAPRTATISFQRIADGGKLVFGGSLISDRTGDIGVNGGMGNFAYRIRLQKDHVLSFGLSAGLRQYGIAVKEINFRDKTDVAIGTSQNQLFPDFSLGVFYNYGEKFYAGLSVPQVFELQTNFRNTTGDLNIGQVRHIYAVLGAYLNVFSNPSAFLEPSIWIRSVPLLPDPAMNNEKKKILLSADINVRAQLNEAFWVGAGGGFSGIVHLETGFIPGDLLNTGDLFKIGLGYDYSTNPYGGTLGHTFEINLSYSW